MSRFEQRKRRRMRDADVYTRYREVSAEFELPDALDQAREALGVNQLQLAEALGGTSLRSRSSSRGHAR
jgi:hypothetical protein